MYQFIIQLHAEGGGGAAGASAGAAPAASGTAAPAQTAAQATPQVLYGRQPSQNPQIRTTSDTAEALSQEFDSLTTGEGRFKGEFDRRVQGIIDRRFKEAKGDRERLDAQSPIMNLLADKYGIADADPVKLAEAIQKDDAYWEDAASDAGMTVEQFRQMRKLERENAQLRNADARRQEAENQRRADETFAGWMQQAETLKQKYPSFDIRQEMANPQFGRLLKSGVDVETAFNAIHSADIAQFAAQGAAQQEQRNVTANIRARGQRPRENGAAASPAVTIKSDVHSFTKADRAEIARRVRNGERIEL